MADFVAYFQANGCPFLRVPLGLFERETNLGAPLRDQPRFICERIVVEVVTFHHGINLMEKDTPSINQH